MDNIGVWILLIVASLAFGLIHYEAGYEPEKNKENIYYKVLDGWRVVVNYFLSGLIAYYFVAVRWPHLNNGQSFSGGDFVLGVIFLAGVFGWLPYIFKNLSENISVIVHRFFGKNN